MESEKLKQNQTNTIVLPFSITLTHFFELRVMKSKKLKQNQTNTNGVDVTKNES